MLTLKTKTWTPPIDLQETDDKLILKAVIPGVRTKELKLRVEENVLIIEGEHQEQECSVDDFICQEMPHGKFKRAIDLPARVEIARFTAELVDGVLMVIMPKKKLLTAT